MRKSTSCELFLPLASFFLLLFFFSFFFQED